MNEFTKAEADFEDRERDDEKFEQSRPVCAICGEHILGDVYFEDDDGKYCEDCWEDVVNDKYSHRFEEE